MAKDSFFEVVKRRRAIRRFKPDPIPEGYIEKILDAARFAPSGANGQPWEFVVVRDAKLRAEMAEIVESTRAERSIIEMSRSPEMRHRGWVAGHVKGNLGIKMAPATIVVLGDPRTLQASILMTHFTSGEWDIFYMNIGNATLIITLAAAALGLQAQWVTIGPTMAERIKRLLGIPEIYRIYVMTPIGYPDYTPAPPYRRELSEMVHYDTYDMSKYRSTKKIQEFIKELRKKSAPHYQLPKSH
jgi:nitroreductase